MSKFLGSDSEQLRLFDCGGVDLARLRVLSDALGVARRAHSTVVAYTSDWRQFVRWCDEAGRGSLPASAETLKFYVTQLLEVDGKRVSTAARRVAAIIHFHRQADVAVPDVAPSRLVLSSVRRDRKERPQGKAALHPFDLRRVSALCDARTLAGARDRALVLLGFATSLRRSELARLQLCDVSFQKQGVAVMVRFSKNDQGGVGRIIAVWAGARPLTDPVSALRRWMSLRGGWDGPLFCRVRADGRLVREGITGEAICEVVKRVVEAAGLDPDSYGAHSLRAGAVTAAAELGRSDQEIMGLSGHASAEVMRMYVRRARVFSGRNPLAGAL